MFKYLSDSEGAVTVDWVVITAGLVGLGLAVMSVTSAGVQDVSGDVDAELTGHVIKSSFSNAIDTFSDGPGEWTGIDAMTMNVAPYGDILGPINGSGGAINVSRTFDVTPGAEEAVITFDVLGINSLDGVGGVGSDDGPVLYIDGVEVARGVIGMASGTTEWTIHDVDGVTVQLGTEQQSPGRYQQPITITVDSPNATIDFGVGSTVNQAYPDEALAIDNVVFGTPGLS